MFEAYQTFFTGLLGFAGVILTLIINGILQRNIIKNEIEHKANSIRTAIKSELIVNKEAYELRIEQFNEKSKFENALIPNTIFNEIYNKLLDQVGALEESEIEKILHAYHLMAELPYKLRILVGTDKVGGIEKEWIQLNRDQFAVATEMQKKFLPIIQNAIDAINQQLDKKT